MFPNDFLLQARRRRLSALGDNRLKLSEEERKRLSLVLQNTEYISSEESDGPSPDSDEKVLVKGRLPWRSAWLDEKFELLDKRARLKNHDQGTPMLKRVLGQNSAREQPEESYVWAVAEFAEPSDSDNGF